MKNKLAVVMLLVLCFPAASAPIDDKTFMAVMEIADREGVPRSVAARLMFEESGDPKTGARGNPKAVGDEDTGYRSLGLYQIHTRPENLEELLRRDWPHNRDDFDIFDPIDNATLALRYLARKHRDLGSWYRAVCYYNSGKTRQEEMTPRTRAYARRIIDARHP